MSASEPKIGSGRAASSRGVVETRSQVCRRELLTELLTESPPEAMRQCPVGGVPYRQAPKWGGGEGGAGKVGDRSGALDGGGGSRCRVSNLKNGHVACQCR